MTMAGPAIEQTPVPIADTALRTGPAQADMYSKYSLPEQQWDLSRGSAGSTEYMVFMLLGRKEADRLSPGTHVH